MTSVPLEDRVDPQLRDHLVNPPSRPRLGRLHPTADRVRATDTHVKITDGPDARDVPVRVYRPAEADADAPVALFVHGGGFTLGELEQFDPHCAWYAAASRAVIVSVGYRLAPQFPYPAALRDAHAVWSWLTGGPAGETGERAGGRAGTGAAEIGVDPARSAIIGSSSGAAIAAGLTLYLRDRQEPLPSLLLLHAPVLDDRHATVSSQAITDPRTWNRAGSQRGWRGYLGPLADAADVPAYAAPARAADLAGLPPTALVFGDLELARDEALAFA
ncbi:alpha/beta hydrolase fold domain-containing protein, partial [Frankia sp. CiP1_Cm_nod2]|uniref:alpha/beta hydrolase fold domain-containing protein n=1 Tax=Frankia sp. CiP1_Cm_nod2 TaxID=2897161 RepID=UPI0020248FF2